MKAPMGPFLVIGLCLLLGFVLRRIGRFPAETPRVLNAYVIAVALPAVVLSRFTPYLRQVFSGALDPAVAILPFVPWTILALAVLFFRALHRAGRIRRDEYAQLVLSAGLGNTAFVGFPLIEATLGPSAIPPAILLDQLGTFLALSVAGTVWLSIFRDGPRPTAARVARNVLYFPPFLALLAAAALAPFGDLPEPLQTALDRIAGTLVPVAMASVGAQLRLSPRILREEARGLAWGLGFKMALAPLAIWALLRLAGARGEPLAIGVLEAAMAPMITSTLLGIEAGLAPSLGTLMLGVGIPLSLVTVPLLHRFFFSAP
jgi:predicted permease